MKKLALFTPNASVFNCNLYFAIKQGFEALGIQVAGMPGLLSDASLAVFCREFGPDAVLEIDRTRNQLPSLPATIPHVAWVVDYVNPHCEVFYGSEILYVMSMGWFPIQDRQRVGARKVAWLLPGFSPKYYYFEEKAWQVDFSFVGHMTNPWSDEERQQVICHQHGREVVFDDLLAHYHQAMEQWAGVPFKSELHNQALNEALSKTGCDLAAMPQPVRYNLTRRLYRMHTRQVFLDEAAKLSNRLSYYGSGGWQAWPAYAPYFHGYLADPDQVRHLYQTTCINLHDVLPSHFRVMDCLASGGFLFIRQEAGDADYETFGRIFQPDKHFVYVTRENFGDKARHYLSHPQQRRDMARRVATEMAAHHSWQARAEQILQDIRQL